MVDSDWPATTRDESNSARRTKGVRQCVTAEIYLVFAMPFTLLSLGTIVLYAWVLEPRVPREAVPLPIAAVLVAGVTHAVRRREWGFASHAFAPALRAAVLFTAPAVAVILIAGAARGTLHV